MIDVTMHRGFTKCPSCRGLATVIAVLLGCCEDSRQVMGVGPVGFDVIHSYTLSDSEKCGDSDGKQLKDGRCGNLGGALKNGGTDTCKGSATGYDVCVKEAADACSGDPACYSFIVPSVGHPGNNWATYAASAGNAAPNDDWDLYHKTVSKHYPMTPTLLDSPPAMQRCVFATSVRMTRRHVVGAAPQGFMPCSACPGGGTPLPNSPNGYRMEWAHHCSTLTTAWNQGSTTKIFCGPPIAAAWVSVTK
jgi:hypothetical protein|eukprot:COSAG02_NODE_1922_length_10360_cov_38.101452_4_plen_248_part_00